MIKGGHIRAVIDLCRTNPNLGPLRSFVPHNIHLNRPDFKLFRATIPRVLP